MVKDLNIQAEGLDLIWKHTDLKSVEGRLVRSRGLGRFWGGNGRSEDRR